MECPPVGAFLAVNGDRGGAAKRKPRREMTNAAKNAIVTECADVVDVAVDVAADVAGDVAFAESERNPQSLDSFFFCPFQAKNHQRDDELVWIFSKIKKKKKKEKVSSFRAKALVLFWRGRRPRYWKSEAIPNQSAFFFAL